MQTIITILTVICLTFSLVIYYLWDRVKKLATHEQNWRASSNGYQDQVDELVIQNAELKKELDEVKKLGYRIYKGKE